jgi:hypothetical protein
MTVAVHPLVDSYLRALDRAAQGLPRPERDELVAEIRSHLDAALSGEATEADVRNVLDQLGSPYDIVAAARPDVPPATGPRHGIREVLALLLLVTGMPPLLGWLVGAGLLLWSPLWSDRQKLLGILVWPGGLFGGFLLLTIPVSVSGSSSTQVCGGSSPGLLQPDANPIVMSCTSSSSVHWWVWPVLVVVFVAPIVVGAYLWRAAGRRSAG